jgi:tetratricopeptide (TPR) repeat protein
MGFRLYKSIGLGKGVRLNVSKTGLGMSVGTKGLRYSVHSSGRRTTSAGIPGSGVRYQTTTTSRGRARTRSGSGGAVTERKGTPAPRKPGLFAPRVTKALYRAVGSQHASAYRAAGDDFPQSRALAHGIAGFLFLSAGDGDEAVRLLTSSFEEGSDPADDPFTRAYLEGASLMRVGIAHGVEAELPICRDAVGLLLAELHQERGDLAAAIDVVEQLEPTTHAALSLAELYSMTGAHDDVIDLTERLENQDDASALLLAFRGIALRERGTHDASLEALKEALRSPSRAREVRHFARSERARTYEAMGQRAQARKDLEKIMAEDSTYDGLAERLADLST